MANKNAQDALNVEDQLSKSEAFFDKNKKTILIAIAAVVLVIAGFFLYKAYVSGPLMILVEQMQLILLISTLVFAMLTLISGRKLLTVLRLTALQTMLW